MTDIASFQRLFGYFLSNSGIKWQRNKNLSQNKKVWNISLHIFAFQNTPSSFHFFPKKLTFSLRTRVPPPLSDMSAKNVIFLDGSPKDKLSSKTQPKANRSCFDICPLFQKNKFLAWPHFTFMSALMKKEMRSS